MEGIETDIPQAAHKPRTITVLVQIAVAAIIFSYVGAIAIPAALASAQVIEKWPAGQDPRSRWFLITFIVLMGCFLVLGGLARFFSSRQLASIDAMEDAADEKTDIDL